MSPAALLVLYCFLILVGSLTGGWLPMMVRLTHERAQMMMSFVAGLMLGVALFVMLPHSVEQPESLDRSMLWLMAGLLTMFFLLRAFHFHQHGPVATIPDAPAEAVHGHACQHEHDHDHGRHREHDHDHDHGGTQATPHRLSWTGIGIGLTIHTLLDGMALAASVQAEAAIHPGALILGLGTFLAILLHKPLDALAITSLMAAAGWTPFSRQVVNAAFGMMVPLGVLIFYVVVGGDSVHASATVSAALAFSAGVFLCISLGDLLPEVQFHSHDRIKLSFLLLLGVGVAYGTSLIERAGHAHPHGGHAHATHR